LVASTADMTGYQIRKQVS